jgi:hypothetical protein
MREQIANHTIPRRATADRTTARHRAAQIDYDVEDDDSYYPQRMPTSTRRYDRGEEVITQGRRRIVIHRELPPKPSHHFHWLFWVGIAMMVMLAGWVLLSMAGTWWTNQQSTWRYGYPRTFQTDQNVGHGTANNPTSHFIAENLHGEIIVIEIPDGDPSKSKIYIGPQLFGDNADLTPVTLSFKDVNGDGKPDMLMHVQDQTIIFLNDGTQFKTPKQ